MESSRNWNLSQELTVKNKASSLEVLRILDSEAQRDHSISGVLVHRFNPQHSGLRIQHCCRCSSDLIPPHATGRPKKNPQKNLFCIFISPTSLWRHAQDSVLGSLPTLIPLMVTLDLFLKIYKLKTFKFMFLVPAFPADFKWVCSPASFTSHVQNQIPILVLHPCRLPLYQYVAISLSQLLK